MQQIRINKITCSVQQTQKIAMGRTGSLKMSALFLGVLAFHCGFDLVCGSGLCRTSCGDVLVSYPFGIDDGCGSPQYRSMFTCDQVLQFHTVSGSYTVENIDYDKKKVVIFSPNISTCNSLQPREDFKMDEVQSVLIPPSPNTMFVLLNCSQDSPLLHRYSSLCSNFSGNSCDELYSCPALNILMGVPRAPQPPPCCATDFKTVKFLSLDIMDCSHYTTIYNADELGTQNPQDWPYGIQLSYSLPDSLCDRCQSTGGTCGYNTETEGMLCICGGMNSTRDCGSFSGATSSVAQDRKLLTMLLSVFLAVLIYTSISWSRSLWNSIS